MVFSGDYNLLNSNETAQQQLKDSVNQSLTQNGVPGDQILGFSIYLASVGVQVELGSASALNAGTNALNNNLITAIVNGHVVTATSPDTTKASSSIAIGGGAIAGIIIGTIAAVVLVVILIKTSRKKESGKYEIDEEKNAVDIVNDDYIIEAGDGPEFEIDPTGNSFTHA